MKVHRNRIMRMALGLENIDLDVPPEKVDDADELVFTDGQMDGELGSEIDSCVQSIMTLESFRSVLVDTKEHAVMNHTGVQMLATAIEHIAQQTKMTTSTVPALEALELNVNSKSLRELSIETIGEVANSIIAKIKEWIRKAIAWVKHTFDKIFGDEKRVVNKIAEAKKAVETRKKEGSEVSPGKFSADFSSTIKSLLGSVTSSSEFLSSLDQFTTECAAILSCEGGYDEKYFDDLVDKLKQGKSQDLATTFVMKKPTIPHMPAVSGWKAPAGSPDNYTYVETRSYFKGASFIGLMNKRDLHGKEGFEAPLNIANSFKILWRNGKNGAEVTLPLLTPEECDKALDKVNKLMGVLSKLSSEKQAVMTRWTNRLDSVISSLSKKNDHPDPGYQEDLKLLVKITSPSFCIWAGTPFHPARSYLALPFITTLSAYIYGCAHHVDHTNAKTK